MRLRWQTTSFQSADELFVGLGFVLDDKWLFKENLLIERVSNNSWYYRRCPPFILIEGAEYGCSMEYPSTMGNVQERRAFLNSKDLYGVAGALLSVSTPASHVLSAFNSCCRPGMLRMSSAAGTHCPNCTPNCIIRNDPT
jgi:hypothetical protein